MSTMHLGPELALKINTKVFQLLLLHVRDTYLVGIMSSLVSLLRVAATLSRTKVWGVIVLTVDILCTFTFYTIMRENRFVLQNAC